MSDAPPGLTGTTYCVYAFHKNEDDAVARVYLPDVTEGYFRDLFGIADSETGFTFLDLGAAQAERLAEDFLIRFDIERHDYQMGAVTLP